MASILFKVVRICNSQFRSNYLKSQSLFLNFFFHFLILQQILNILKKNMMGLANVLPKLQTVNILVRPLSKKCRLGTLFYSEHVKASLKPCEMSMRALHSCFSSFSGKLIWKIPPLVLCETLGLSVNTLTSDGKYPVQGCEILQLQFKCNYLINEKILLHFLFHFWILQQISKTLKEKMTVIANVFPKLQTVKRFVRKLSEEHRFRTGFGSQYVKDSQMLAQFP